MEAQKDANGFEVQTTVAAGEKRKVIPAEPPKVPEKRDSLQGPPKPSKTSTPSTNGARQSTGSVENGTAAKFKAEEAGQPGLALNAGYFKSWQATLKVVKMV